MRMLIFIGGAALAVAACQANEPSFEAENNTADNITNDAGGDDASNDVVNATGPCHDGLPRDENGKCTDQR